MLIKFAMIMIYLMWEKVLEAHYTWVKEKVVIIVEETEVLKILI